VLGDPVEPTLAADLAGLEAQEASAAAEALAEAMILGHERPLEFVHPLVRSSIYFELSAEDRAGQHERAARVLAKRKATADRVAAHLLATNPGGDPETVSTLREAASSARNRGAPDAAVTYLERALAESPLAELAPMLVYELGAAALSAGQLDLAIERLRQATEKLADGPLHAEAASALGSALFLADRPEEAMTELTE